MSSESGDLCRRERFSLYQMDSPHYLGPDFANWLLSNRYIDTLPFYNGSSKEVVLINDRVTYLSCYRHGAEVVEPKSASSSKRSSTFVGTGYRLGQSTTDSEGNQLYYMPWLVKDREIFITMDYCTRT